MVFLQNLSLADIVETGFLASGTTVQLNGTEVEGVITSNGRLQLDNGQTYTDPDEAAAELLTTRAPRLRWHDWTTDTSKTLAMIADEARSASIQAEPSDPVEQLGLSARTTRILKSAGITRVRDVSRSYSQLDNIDGVGQQSIAEITAALAASDLAPAASPPDLAALLSNLSRQLEEVGQSKEALAAVQHAVTISQQLAGDRSDSFLPDLAGRCTASFS